MQVNQPYHLQSSLTIGYSLNMNVILPELKPQELAIDLPADQAGDSSHLVFKLNSGRTYQVLSSSRSKKISLLHRLASLANIALIASEGGLISNLTVQENILLPVQYRSIMSDDSALQNAIAILMRFKLSQNEVFQMLQLPPANLSLFERRLVSFARAMVVEPEILVCDTIFEGLTDDEVAIVSRFNVFFHLHFPFRTVIFLELGHTRGIIDADKVFHLQ